MKSFNLTCSTIGFNFRIFILLLVSVLFISCSEETSSPSDVENNVYKIDSKPYGKTYSEWACAWWQWVFSVPADDGAGNSSHPLFDLTGENWAVGQNISSSSVIFLAGVFNETGSATRNITIPSGKALFFPILNSCYDTVGLGYIHPDTLIAMAKPAIDACVDLSCEIDGKSVSSVASYKVKPSAFNYTLPENNLYGIAPTTVYGAVSLGYYLMVQPLPKGVHTIHFHGKMPGESDFILDITYNIAVN